MRVRAKDLKPGMKIVFRQKPVIVSNLTRCPDCNKPNYCEDHDYAYIDNLIKNMFIFTANGDESAELERIV